MAINFPDTPSVNQIYSTGGSQWRWTGTKWVASGVTNIVTIGDTPPTTPIAGSEWFDSTEGNLYLWYVDPSGPGQWVPASSISGLFTIPIPVSQGGTGATTGSAGPYVPVNALYASTQSNYTPVTNMPTGTTMMGLGNFFTIRPNLTGRVHVILSTVIAWNGNAITGSINNMYFGTGTPPASKSTTLPPNFVTLTYQMTSAANAAGVSQQEPVTITAVLLGLTPGTTYWIDCNWNCNVAGINIFSSNMTAIEV
jgi:hypothetical protein